MTLILRCAMMVMLGRLGNRPFCFTISARRYFYARHIVFVSLHILLSLRAILHRRKPQTIGALLFVRRDKAQMMVDLHRTGRRIDREHRMGVVTAHGLEQLFADAPAVIGRIHEKTADMLGRSHTQCPNQFVAIKSAIKGQPANSLLILETCPEMVNALL